MSRMSIHLPGQLPLVAVGGETLETTTTTADVFLEEGANLEAAATFPGVLEIELERSRGLIDELQVTP